MSINNTQAFLWQGRIDSEDSHDSRRLHQQVKNEQNNPNFEQAPVLLGFACDEGVKRNQGVVGAAKGPLAIRRALSNLACSEDFEFYDLGDVGCEDGQLENAQNALADQITDVLNRDGRPFIAGGGHEVGWASFLGAQQYLQKQEGKPTLGILNFDAHFDLRNPQPFASSGTPFRQAQVWCEANEVPFQYAVFGINSTVNTDTLFHFAWEHQVTWVEDLDCHLGMLEELKSHLDAWLQNVDYVYLTVCLDVFSPAHAPGVSAPATVGVEPVVVLKLLQHLQETLENTEKKILVVDVAELNPERDPDSRTAKLAARYLYQMMMT